MQHRFLIKKGFVQLSVKPGEYEQETLIEETELIIIEQGHFTGGRYPSFFKPKFSTLGSIIEIFN